MNEIGAFVIVYTHTHAQAILINLLVIINVANLIQYRLVNKRFCTVNFSKWKHRTCGHKLRPTCNVLFSVYNISLKSFEANVLPILNYMILADSVFVKINQTNVLTRT